MKIKVNTEKLLLAAFNLPDVSPTEMSLEFKCGTHGLYNDLFAGRDAEDVIGLECPELIPVYKEFARWKRQRKVCYPNPYKQYRNMLRSILKKQGAPEEVEMTAYTSIYAVLAVCTEIKYFTGYDITETKKMFCIYLKSTNLKIALLSADFLSEINNRISFMKYDVLHWYNKNYPLIGVGSMAVWKANFSSFVDDVIKRYGTPLYFKI